MHEGGRWEDNEGRDGGLQLQLEVFSEGRRKVVASALG